MGIVSGGLRDFAYLGTVPFIPIHKMEKGVIWPIHITSTYMHVYTYMYERALAHTYMYM